MEPGKVTIEVDENTGTVKFEGYWYGGRIRFAMRKLQREYKRFKAEQLRAEKMKQEGAVASESAGSSDNGGMAEGRRHLQSIDERSDRERENVLAGDAFGSVENAAESTQRANSGGGESATEGSAAEDEPATGSGNKNGSGKAKGRGKK